MTLFQRMHEASNDGTLWTLGRVDAEGRVVDSGGDYALLFDEGYTQVLSTIGSRLTAAWALGMPGPKDPVEAMEVIDSPEKFEAAALDWLSARVGSRGPRPIGFDPLSGG